MSSINSKNVNPIKNNSSEASNEATGKIELTKKQFFTLLKIVYIGNWLANAHRTTDRIKEYDEITDYIFSHAKQFGFAEYVDEEEAAEGKYYSTRQFEEETEVGFLHEEYNNDTFWEELIERLAVRDTVRNYGEESLAAMDDRERISKIWDAREKYEKIFSEAGLDAVEVEEIH